MFPNGISKRVDFVMPSGWVRLIACVALAAFLVANGTAVAHHSLPLPRCRCGDAACAPSKDISPDNAPASPCQHCRAKQKRQIAFDSSQGNNHRQISPSSPACPCEQENPTKFPCPCPGGCMVCNVAKVPCVAPTILPPESITCTGHCLAETPPIFLPPFCGELMRPPRA